MRRHFGTLISAALIAALFLGWLAIMAFHLATGQ